MIKVLRATNMDKCIGCSSCTLACARLVHKTLSWEKAGIRIHSPGGLSTGFEATYCLACDPAPCIEPCPTAALVQRKGGGIIFKSRLCIHCGKCAKACPIGAIYFDPEKNIPIFCLHCGKCVAFCPHGCLELVEIPLKEHTK